MSTKLDTGYLYLFLTSFNLDTPVHETRYRVSLSFLTSFNLVTHEH
jgi:hypothetical protein